MRSPGPATDLLRISKNVDAGSHVLSCVVPAEPAVEDEVADSPTSVSVRRSAVFEKHGAEVVAVWQRLDDPNTLVWMLAYRDRAHRQEVWKAFAADPPGRRCGKIRGTAVDRSYMMSATDYSKLK